jgi:hypothetical protein
MLMRKLTKTTQKRNGRTSGVVPEEAVPENLPSLTAATPEAEYKPELMVKEVTIKHAPGGVTVRCDTRHRSRCRCTQVHVN